MTISKVYHSKKREVIKLTPLIRFSTSKYGVRCTDRRVLDFTPALVLTHSIYLGLRVTLEESKKLCFKHSFNLLHTGFFTIYLAYQFDFSIYFKRTVAYSLKS